MSEQIWYEDLGGFITSTNYFKILPLQNMSLEEKLNAIVRFLIYLGVILAILFKDSRYLFFGIIACIVSVVLYEFERKQRVKAERFLKQQKLDIIDNEVCARSTVDNPFMNPNITDINNPRPPACASDNPRVRQAVETNFEKRLYRDVSDLYGKMASQRQFYTMPSTTIPNNQEGFAKWCYGKGPSCKEGNGLQCVENTIDDLQYRGGKAGLEGVNRRNE